MAGGSSGSQGVADGGLTKGARITGDQRSSLATAFGERYAGGESIRSIAQDTGRSYGFVHGVLKESGAALRGRGGATRGPRRAAVDPIDRVADQVDAASGEATASPTRTKAKAAKDKLVDKAAEKVAKAKSAKDDKAKKKAEPKKSSKKAKKG